MHPTEQKIKLALQNSEAWIEYLAGKPEKDLEKRLRVNHAQFAIAEKNKDELSCTLLNIMERIIIEARLYKETHNIPDAENDIANTIKETEKADVIAEIRQQVLQGYTETVKHKTPHPKQIGNDNDQLKLF